MLSSLLSEYSAFREKAEAEAGKRRADCYAREPRLKQIADERIRLHFLSGKQKLLQTDPETSDAQAKLQALDEEETALLKRMGIDPASLAPAYRCMHCRDTGYVGYPVRKMCACLQNRLLQAKVKDAGLNASDASFERFDLDLFPDDQLLDGKSVTQRDFMRKVLEIVQKYVADFSDTQKPNLLLLGKTGLGKTYLLDCVARAVLEKGFIALKQTAYAFLNHAFEQIRLKDRTHMDIFLQADLLLLDDLGSEPFVDNISSETLFSVLNERMLAGRHTVIATNLRLKDLHERYGERILTRISDQATTDILQLQGKDIRFHKRA